MTLRGGPADGQQLTVNLTLPPVELEWPDGAWRHVYVTTRPAGSYTTTRDAGGVQRMIVSVPLPDEEYRHSPGRTYADAPPPVSPSV